MLFYPDGFLITGRYARHYLAIHCACPVFKQSPEIHTLLGSMVLHENTQVNAFYVFGQCNAKNF